VKKSVDAIQHVLVLYKFAAVGLRDSRLHTRDEAGLIVEHAGNSAFHQLLGVLAIGRGQLLEPRFDLGGEMYFHAFKLRENRGLGNGKAKAQQIRFADPHNNAFLRHGDCSILCQMLQAIPSLPIVGSPMGILEGVKIRNGAQAPAA
jgi:hypothetical protein